MRNDSDTHLTTNTKEAENIVKNRVPNTFKKKQSIISRIGNDNTPLKKEPESELIKKSNKKKKSIPDGVSFKDTELASALSKGKVGSLKDLETILDARLKEVIDMQPPNRA
jgi:molecular chaperone GrpE (heat shock protein)